MRNVQTISAACRQSSYLTILKRNWTTISYHHVAPPLPGSTGAPPLPVLITSNPTSIQQWLADHIPLRNKHYSHSVLGFDIESIAKTPFLPDRNSLPDGPATVQLATPESCLVVPLARCGNGSAKCAPAALRDVINDEKVIKVGVEVDWDAIELYRWSKPSNRDSSDSSSKYSMEHSADEHIDDENSLKHLSSTDEPIRNEHSPSILWSMTSRFDIGCILPDSAPHRTSGTKEIAKRVLGVDIPKNSNLSMSNWGLEKLSPEQIAYAARDAWVGAAVVEKLRRDSSSFTVDRLMDMGFMKNQRTVREIDERAATRKRLRAELKRKTFLEKKERGRYEARIRELRDELKSLRPDRPPMFDESDFALPFY